jgi:hypothetical protein
MTIRRNFKELSKLLEKNSILSVIKRFLLPIFLVASFQLQAFALPDSLHVQLWGGGDISDQKPAGIKGSESGIIDAWMTHCFSDAVFCTVYLKGAQDFPTPFIEEASLGYRYNTFSARGGMLSTHIGRASLYKPFSVFNRFTRTSVVWDSYGFGASLGGRLGNMGLSGAATLNARENGAAHILWTVVNNPAVCERVLIGIQTASLDNQDNSLTVGDDITLSLSPLDVHFAAQYTAYQGYGNPTVKPGDLVEAFAEARVVPVVPLSLSAMVFYENLEKGYIFVNSGSSKLEYSFQSMLCGFDAQYMAISWLGVYAGYEYQRNMSAVTNVPAAGIAVSPFAHRTLVRVGWESAITGTAALNRIAAIVWFIY